MKFFMLFCYQWNYVFLLIKELSGTLEVEIDGAFELFFFVFLFEIHYMQGWTARSRYDKEAQKD